MLLSVGVSESHLDQKHLLVISGARRRQKGKFSLKFRGPVSSLEKEDRQRGREGLRDGSEGERIHR